MNLNIVYWPNETGKKFYGLLEEKWGDLSRYETRIDDQHFWLIEIPDPSSRINRIINTPKAIKICQDSDAVYRMMAANNIHSGPQGDETVNRSYEVLVCDNDILSIKVNTFLKTGEKARYIKEIENAKVAEISRRVASVLGLDLGMVNIDFTARRRFKVVGVNPVPEMREKDLAKVVQKIRTIYSLDTVPREVKLGADPEFMLASTKTGKMLSASQFFPRDGQIGCDNIRVPNRQQRPVAEVRPTPAFCPIDLTLNIKKCLEQASRMAPYRNVKWVAGSQPFAGYSIGGHIHFSNIKLDAALLRALDNYLGITSFLLENPNTAVRRRKKYGHLSEYRLKNHGGFEYRTPGSWLVNREITAAILCLAKIISSRYYQMNKNYLNNPEAQEAFYKGNQDYFRELFPEIWADIEMSDLYGEYAEVLRVIPQTVAAGRVWDESEDIRKAWKVSNNAKKDYAADYSGSRISSASGTAASVPVVTSRQRQVIRNSTSTNISYRRTAARGVRSVGSGAGRGNSLSQGRMNVSSTRRTQITR